MTKKLDALTFYAFLFAFTFVVTSIGCETLKRLGEAAVTPNPATGGLTPGEQILDGALGVTLNPLSWPSWGKIVGGAVAIGVAVWGSKKALTKKA